MTIVELNPPTEYTCLSYTWGAPELSKAITVNSQRLPVRDNLHAFLQECVRRDQCINTPLWIDAVCINQDDIPEKKKQVAMMGEIYSHAKQVIIWLGSGDILVEAAIDHVKRYMDEVPYDPEAADAELEKIDGTSINTKPVDDLGRPVREYWDNYDVIASQPYWARMWIVQELLLAKDVQVWYGGGRILTLDDLDQYNWFIQIHVGPPGTNYLIGRSKIQRSACGWLVKRYFSETRRFGSIANFQNTFSQLRRQLCFDKRDLVYALRALDSDMRDIPVRYDQHAAFLLPKLFTSDAVRSEPERLGPELIERLDLDVEEVTRLTGDTLPDSTFGIGVENVGLITNATRSLGEWNVDWSAFRIRRGRSDDTKFENGPGLLNSDPLVDISPGDLILLFNWTNIILVYHVPGAHDRAEVIGRITTLAGGRPPAYTDLQPIADKYSCLTALELHKDIWSRKRNECPTLKVLPCRSSSLIRSLQGSPLRFAGITLETHLTWPTLLRFWALKDTGLLNRRPGGPEPVGSWDEEEAKAHAAKN